MLDRAFSPATRTTHGDESTFFLIVSEKDYSRRGAEAFFLLENADNGTVFPDAGNCYLHVAKKVAAARVLPSSALTELLHGNVTMFCT